MTATVKIYVITYRRPRMLERALRSIVAQTHTDWVAEVLNDDPADNQPAELIGRMGDPRIQLSLPSVHRGGTGNFNQAFRAVPQPFASILEDDNWWEPGFLSTMLEALNANPSCVLACGNERLWREESDESATDTGRTIWERRDGVQLYEASASGKCGPARLANSSLLYRTERACEWRTPDDDMPLDFTEHVRERIVPHPILLVRKPLVNFTITLVSHRSQESESSRKWETALIGSVFVLIPKTRRRELAAAVWKQTRANTPLFATALLTAGWLLPEATELWQQGSLPEKLRFFFNILRRPGMLSASRDAISPTSPSWQFLMKGWFAEALARGHIPV